MTKWISIYTFHIVSQIISSLNGFFFNSYFPQEIPLNIKFKIYYLQSNGVLFFIIDKDLNWIFGNIMLGTIEIKRNYQSNTRNLGEFCGCQVCDKTFLEFHIQIINSSNQSVTCNNQLEINFAKIYKFHTPNRIKFPIPKNYKIKNGSHIYLGNFGPYSGDNNLCYLPKSRELKGCINYLTINGNPIVINRASHCQIPCQNKYFNKTKCISQLSQHSKCICEHCSCVNKICYEDRKVLKENQYITWNISPLHIVNNNTVILTDIELSWKPYNAGNYDLLKIFAKEFKVNIHVNNSNLKMNMSSIHDNHQIQVCINIIPNVTHTLNLQFSQNHINIKCNGYDGYLHSNFDKYEFKLINGEQIVFNYKTENYFHGEIYFIYKIASINSGWLVPDLQINITHNSTIGKSDTLHMWKRNYQYVIIPPILIGIGILVFITFFIKRKSNIENNKYFDENVYEVNMSQRYRPISEEKELNDNNSTVYEELNINN